MLRQTSPSVRSNTPISGGSPCGFTRRWAVCWDRGLPVALITWLVAAITLGSTAPLAAQAVDDRLVPSGSVRVSVWPSFSMWDERFGPDGARTGLGQDVTAESAHRLFPGWPLQTAALQALSGIPDYTPAMGPVEGRVSQDVTRLDLGLHIGVTDWWTVGVTVPRIKNRTAVDLVFAPDTIGGDLGVSPYLTARGEVDAFLGALASASAAATVRANTLCGGGAPECAAATALAERASFFHGTMSGAYGAAPFFPLEGSSVGLALVEAVTALDADLTGAGLDGVTAVMPFSTGRASEGDLSTLPVRFNALGYAVPLQTRTGLWTWGDIEISTFARVLDVTRGDRWSMEVIAGGTVRLGTGIAASPDIPLALGAGDGQTDVEGRVAAHATLGQRLSLRVGGLYGVQGSRTVVRRVPSDGFLLAPASARTMLEWDPGAYRALEVEPGLRLAQELTLSGTYRYFGQGADGFRSADGGPVVPVGETASRHEIGGSLVYDTVARSRAGEASPFRFRVRVLHAVSGRGADIPAATRVDLGAELFKSLWGGR